MEKLFLHKSPGRLLTLWLAVVLCRPALADWPQHRNDANRSGYSAAELPAELVRQWVHRSPHAPVPAWKRSDRMQFDRAFQVIVAGGQALYGSSADGVLYALDLRSGQPLWHFFTDGPIRFAPAAWQDRVFVASDDGHLYALSLADGKLLWKRRGGPDDRLVLGNQRMISRWPARGGPLVVDDVVYFAAGIWPSEGIYLYALDARTGAVRWCNLDSGAKVMPQPHGGANAASGISAQGYLVASQERLLVPTGRAVPAAFDRQTGEFEYFHLQKYGQNGGAFIMSMGDMFFNRDLVFREANGDRLLKLASDQIVAMSDGIVRAVRDRLEAGRWEEVEKPDRKGTLVKTRILQPVWDLEGLPPSTALIVAGEKVVHGSAGRVRIVDSATREQVWSASVDGAVYGLAAAHGRLLVSTDAGVIYCFGDTAGTVAGTADRSHDALAYTDHSTHAAAADEIVRATGVREGYCLDLGCGDGALAFELARRTNLQIYAVDEDPRMVKRAREKLSAAGLYGVRVVVHQREPATTGYPDFFADLVVSGRSVLNGAAVVPQDEARRVQRPGGGILCLGTPQAMVVSERPPLQSAGRWTHQYADAANTLNSRDSLVDGRLGMLWFRDVDFDIPQRHGRAPAPLCDGGRIFHQGLNGIIAVDAYNGRELWRYDIPDLSVAYDGDELMGVAGTGGNVCLEGDSLFVRHEGKCLRLDVATGERIREYQMPRAADEAAAAWGYIAAADGMLYGSEANRQHIVTYRFRDTTGDLSKLATESRSLFAIDIESGDVRWHYRADASIRHNAIAIADGKVFLIDRPLALFDREKKPASKEHPLGKLVALDAKTGATCWQVDQDVYGTMLAASDEQGVLLMSYQPTRFRLDSEFGGRMTGIRSADGTRLWDVEAEYASRPLIHGDVVYAQGGAWNLLTGDAQPFPFKRSYGCGILAAGRNMIVFRSATLGYASFSEPDQVQNYGGIRPGCWVNAIPAAGLVLVPDATSGCQCSYLNKAWFALQPMED
ncbi:MAG: PQQ-binding-like beta-propeller repeat protein [Pirellulaceae bacterium]